MFTFHVQVSKSVFDNEGRLVSKTEEADLTGNVNAATASDAEFLKTMEVVNASRTGDGAGLPSAEELIEIRQAHCFCVTQVTSICG